MDLNRFGLYRLLVRQDKTTCVRVVSAALLAGLLQGGMIIVINGAASAMQNSDLNLRYLLMFLLLLGGYSLASHYSTSRTIALTERVIFAAYLDVADKLRRMHLVDFEEMGKSRIYSTLHTSTDIVLEASKNLANVGAAFIMILVSGIYIASISIVAIAIIVVFYLFGYFVYRTNLQKVSELINKASLHDHQFKDRFKYFLEGFKELKVARNKSATLYNDYIRPEARQAEKASIRAEKKLSANMVFIQSYYYLIVTSMIFLLPQVGDMSNADILKVAAVLLFTYGSMTRIVQSIPLILKAERALDKLHSLDQELDIARESNTGIVVDYSKLPASDLSIQLDNVSFTYQHSDHVDDFTLGPVSLDLKPGELVFIVGSNGAGKTTLLKLLTGLYRPDSGMLYLGGRGMEEQDYPNYRDLFSVVFPDYYLFDRLYGQRKVDEEKLSVLLDIMGLRDRVAWDGERFQNLNLSAGQCKRLALACAHMDDSPFLVLDEVAADLDPEFRQFYYQTYLPNLRKSGKTVIAISHDQQYFGVADRTVKLDSGRIVE
ncbi:MAG: ABC transporter ATP-binding protein [marine bacterium B5-7]|nr:MAG: ABC transporter ATP-binding protein [marine bacterium B5-7]